MTIGPVASASSSEMAAAAVGSALLRLGALRGLVPRPFGILDTPCRILLPGSVVLTMLGLAGAVDFLSLLSLAHSEWMVMIT